MPPLSSLIFKEYPMAKFEYALSEDQDEDRVYVRVDDVFDISILRTEEGLIIDVYDNDEIDLLGTIAIFEDSLARNREDSQEHI
jgi:hypothetical protein